ncbi:MAG: hypothetical protein IJT24_05510, partial [Lachnospiraceae bacterium]|nr:hypothetical protein [Lachnospiraceae bacterium]
MLRDPLSVNRQVEDAGIQYRNTWNYISDGPYRKYDIGFYLIEFKHCANKEISGKSFITITVIQAIKHIGKDKMQPEDIERLSKTLSKSD